MTSWSYQSEFSRKLCFHRRFLDTDRIDAAARDAHAGAQLHRVAETVRARQDLHGAAAKSGDVIDRRLDDAMIRTDEIRLLRADGDLDALTPIRAR